MSVVSMLWGVLLVLVVVVVLLLLLLVLAGLLWRMLAVLWGRKVELLSIPTYRRRRAKRRFRV